ncbi:hypothetical protein [Streptomyces niveus]|uniref:hypothetical protein n=1 Tax=Streptomyces niveus TaxID=193462 RepID=UPI0036E28BC0
MATTAEGDLELSRWDAATGALDPVARFAGGDSPLGVYPMEVTPDGAGVWLGSNRGSDRLRLARLDLATGEEHEVDSHPSYDLDTRAQVFPALPAPLIRCRRTGELLGVRYLGARQVIHALDPQFAAVLEIWRSCPTVISPRCPPTRADGGGWPPSPTTATPGPPTSTTTPRARAACSTGRGRTSPPSRWRRCDRYPSPPVTV